MQRVTFRTLLAAVLSLACATASRGQTSQPAWDPPPITLQLSGVAPQEAFRQLGEMVGLTFDMSGSSAPDRPTSIDVDIKDQPFWLAVKQVCDASRMELTSSSDATARLGGGGDQGMWSRNIAVSSGPVLFVLNNLQRDTKVDLREPNRTTRRADLNFMIYIDPRVRAAQAQSAMVVTEATDDKGQKLKQANPGNSGTFHNAWSLYESLALDLPAEPGTKITRLAGDSHFLVDVKTEALEIKLPMTEKITRKIGSFPLVLSDVRKEGGNWRVKISYDRAGGDKAAYERLRPAFEQWTRRLEVYDESGRTFRRGGWSGSSSDDARSVELYLEPPEQNVDAVKLVWPIPVEVKDIAIPFELTDLPLEKPQAAGEKKSDG